jgi:hypothetical protein
MCAKNEKHPVSVKILPYFAPCVILTAIKPYKFSIGSVTMTADGGWGKIIDKKEAERFVGREQELETFRQQISCTPPDYFIFYITGQGGVGKTTLLNHYREIAKDLSFLLTDCDEIHPATSQQY